jgi:helicase
MTFSGLFIGIDKYKTPINRLSCAAADALALSGLFEDTLGGQVKRLIDGDATQIAIKGAMELYL